MAASAWGVTTLGAVAHVEMGQSPPSQFVSDSDGAGEPFLQGNAEFSSLHPVPRLWCRKPAKMSKAGDVLISVRAPVGAINRADRGYCIGRGLAAVRFTGIDPGFGFHALGLYSAALRRVAQGTTFEAVGGVELRALHFPQCAEWEQRHIAAVLDTLDKAIRLTEQVIAKLQQMKQGLLHDLLTRGVNENGVLRPPPAEAPHLYKDSPLGRIPAGWTAERIASTALPGKAGFDDGDWIETPYITTEGIRLIQTGNIGVGEFLDKPDSRRFISTRTFSALGCKWVHPGDVLVCRMADPIGRACVVPACVGDSITAVDCTIYRPSPEKARTTFMNIWLNSALHLKMANDVAGGSTRQRISRSALGHLLVALPDTQEQDRIAQAVEAVTHRLHHEGLQRAKLHSLKSGLTHDLLTGRVRVPVPAGALA